jgi:hypothetical protein
MEWANVKIYVKNTQLKAFFMSVYAQDFEAMRQRDEVIRNILHPPHNPLGLFIKE